VLWATETTLVTYAAGVPPLEIVALAFAAAAMLSPAVWWVTGDSPLAAFRQPLSVWLVTVPAITAYHACIYFSLQEAPPAPAALLGGCTPLFIVLGSAFLPGERLRWWHIVGAIAGAEGLICLVIEGGQGFSGGPHRMFYLGCVGAAAGLWGVYSLVSRRFGDVPTSAMGTFYAAAAVLAGIVHLATERWVTPTLVQSAAIAGLGLLPMGLALLIWDYGVKKGDIQALGASSYVEPLIGALLVQFVGAGQLQWPMLISAGVILGGALVASAGLWADDQHVEPSTSSETNALIDQLRTLAVSMREAEATLEEISPSSNRLMPSQPIRKSKAA
jgi:drug/metabolite transporter (DMT)-like permease